MIMIIMIIELWLMLLLDYFKWFKGKYTNNNNNNNKIYTYNYKNEY